MILTLPDGRQLRGDLISSSVLRYDLAPIPLTLEAEIRLDESIERQLDKGETVTLGSGEVMRIIKSVKATSRSSQGSREVSGVKITALIDSCHKAAFVRSRAIIKENATLSEIYRASDASIRAVDADFSVPRFYCPIGDTPTFHIAKILQEEGGAVRWDGKKIQFIRLRDLFRQKESITLPDNASDNVDSGFLERHEVPWFFSTSSDAALIYGNRDKPRAVRYSPFKDAQKLINMSRALIHRKTLNVNLNMRLKAGDLVKFVGADPLVVVTAAHVSDSGTDDGGASSTYTRLWLSSFEE